jgi:hypothetical protein
VLAQGATAFAATVAGAGLITLEVAIGRSAVELDGWSGFAARMLGLHACAGMLEALATMGLLALLAPSRRASGAGLALAPARAGAVGLASLAVALVSLPSLGLASATPDAYEAALAAVAQAGHALGGIEAPERLSGLAATVAAWQDATTSGAQSHDILFAVLGAAAAGAGAGLCALACGRRPAGLAAAAEATS